MINIYWHAVRYYNPPFTAKIDGFCHDFHLKTSPTIVNLADMFQRIPTVRLLRANGAV